MAAARAGESGADVLLLEKTSGAGKKLLMSGNSRCNVTNAVDMDRFIEMFGRNGRFLHGTFRRFFRNDLTALLDRYGVQTKTEPDGRVFPASDDSRDVLRALQRYCSEYKVVTQGTSPVTEVLHREGRVNGVITGCTTIQASCVVLATGGSSYCRTGSTGDGYRFAEKLGHSVVRIRPALVPLVVKEKGLISGAQGISLRDVRLTAFRNNEYPGNPPLLVNSDYGRGIPGRKPPKGVIESRRGDVMLTHFGLGGPATLLLSLAVVDALTCGPVVVSIDLFPDLDEKALGKRLQRDFDTFGKRICRNVLDALLPDRMVPQVLRVAGVPDTTPANQIDAVARAGLVRGLKSLAFEIEGPLSLETAFVTAGGVALDEIDPRTMESRKVDGLFFAGEVTDLDAPTGGYNLQAAFSTGWVAGEQAALKSLNA